MPLKERFKQIPQGLQFLQPETQWKPRPWASFDEIVNSLISHRQGNPSLLAKGWSTDRKTVESEVDAYNTAICKAMGWTDYIVEGGGAAATPFPAQSPQRSLLERSRQLAAGAGVQIDFIKSREEAVPAETAAVRAKICVDCQFNVKGGLETFFTKPASEAVRRGLELARGWKLSIPQSEMVNICDVCLCPLKLKIWIPLSFIQARMPAEVGAAMPDWCWIKRGL